MSKPDKQLSVWRELFEYVKMVIFVMVFVLILQNYLIINAKIPSESMENTIMTGDRVIGNRLSYLIKKPERFDIIIFKFPDDESLLYIKRIIGMPGEKVEVRDGKVYIDDSETPLDDSFVLETPLGNWGPYVVPEDHYFVMGDNRNDSKDSRYWTNTSVAKDKIEGKAVLRYFPGLKILK